MAEVASNSTVTPPSYLPPRKKARVEEEGTAGAFKPVGSLTFLIDNFREFSELPPGESSMRHCDAKVIVRGLTFGLAVYPNRCVAKKDPTEECICMGLIVKCENTSECNVNGDGSWSCLASMTFRVKTLLKSRPDHVDEFTHRFFSSGKDKSSLEWYDVQPLRFDFLMNPKYDLYDMESDSLELIVEISADAPVGVMDLPKMDTIQVNEETVEVNKSLLAVHSRYFHSLFYNAQFDEGQSGVYKVMIEAPATVEHFKRMLQTFYPENKPLDDECIEGVLHLANRFLVTVVEGKCVEFLKEKSTKSALFKYRVADKYGCTALKKHVLRKLKITDFEKDLFRANVTEYVQLGPGAAEALLAHYDALFISESDEEEDE